MDLKNPTRTEALLANIAGHTDVPVPDMKNATRSERLLKEILDNGGGDVTKEYVETAIADAVADIDDDISALSDTVADKVDKENGKSLSTNDYTDADKALVQDSPITVSATGSDLTLSTSSGNINALTVYGKSEIVDGEIVSAGESGSIEVQTYTGTNQFGGLDFAQKLNTASNISVINTTDKTVTFQRRSDITPIVYDNFKPNTQYTFIMTYSNTSLNNCLRIKYDTGIDDVFEFTASNTKSTIVLTTDSARNVKQLYLTFYSAGETTLYYDECGIFEGVKTSSDFEPYTGTMATFTTGTPLRSIPDTTVRDVMAWDGSSGEVTKVCGEAKLANLTWGYSTQYTHSFFAGTLPTASQNVRPSILSSNYIEKLVFNDMVNTNKSYCIVNNSIRIRDDDYTTVEDFVASLGDAELVYELATPTTEQLTTAENDSIAGLRTFAPQTHAQNNAGTTMTVEAYAGTANGQAVQELKQDVQSEISALKITQSATLTLTTAGWTNNAQTVTYEHDTGKRNTIDVEPANIKAWTAAGILATAETASTITFECDTVPTADLSFRVTSMEVR